MFDYFDGFSDDRDDVWECLLCLLFCKIQYHIWSQWNVQLLVIVGIADMFRNYCGYMMPSLFSEYPSTRAGSFVWPEKCSGGERFQSTLYLSHFVFTRRQMGRHEISVELYTYFV
jgi:hypothetical protein